MSLGRFGARTPEYEREPKVGMTSLNSLTFAPKNRKMIPFFEDFDPDIFRWEERDLEDDGLIERLTSGWPRGSRLDESVMLSELARTGSNYLESEGRKSDGSVRYLSSPVYKLKEIQKALLVNFLSDPVLVHSGAFAYVRGRSAVQCARLHERAVWLIKIDLRDFFTYIDERRIYWTLLERGNSKFSSFLVARITTRSASTSDSIYSHLPKRYKRNRRHLLSKKFSVGNKRLGFLPQGSPTSGAISNLVCFNLDNDLAAVAHKAGLSYSRYSDDIIFSSDQVFDRKNAEAILRQSIKKIRSRGFLLNAGKTRIIPPGARKKVLGLLVGDAGLRLPRETRAQIDSSLHFMAKFGIERHAKKVGHVSPAGLLKEVSGRLVWAYEVNPAWATSRLVKLASISGAKLPEVPDGSRRRWSLRGFPQTGK